MHLPENCQRLRIYIGDADQWQHRPLYEALVFKAREAGLAGATVFRSPMGYGANSRVHTAKIVNFSTDLPIVVEVVDTEEKILVFVEQIKGLITGGLITTEPVRILHYAQHGG